jgi:beta-catenin-like protein 1
LISFEKKINKNQKMRMKHSEEPMKFMDSELELHAELKELYAVAASPELYPVLVEAGSVPSILGMITHENTDISIEAVGLIQEMTEVDTIQEEDSAMIFIDALLANQGLELIVQNLSRLDEANDEDAQGVYNSMGIIENLVELKPQVAVLICARTQILKFLLLRLKVKKFDANKLYCSEILSILLQASESNQRRVCNLQGMDGMETLLQSVAQYRKKDPASLDEEVRYELSCYELTAQQQSIKIEQFHMQYQLLPACLFKSHLTVLKFLKISFIFSFSFSSVPT